MNQFNNSSIEYRGIVISDDQLEWRGWLSWSNRNLEIFKKIDMSWVNTEIGALEFPLDIKKTHKYNLKDLKNNFKLTVKKSANFYVGHAYAYVSTSKNLPALLPPTLMFYKTIQPLFNKPNFSQYFRFKFSLKKFDVPQGTSII